MPDIELSLEAQRSIDDFARSERDLAPSQLKIPEIIPGCVVVDIDPHGVGLGTLPRLIQVRINEFLQLVLWSGFPTLAVGSVCTVVRRGTGNTYQVSGVSGATGVLTDADVYRYHWVYDITLNALIAYDTVVGASAYPALASGDFVLMKPGTIDESVTLVDGVIFTEQVPGTVIIHSTSADVAVTCVDGGYLQCKEIRSTRGAGNNAYAVDISGLGAGESCDIYCEDAIATQTGATGAENAHAILGGGLGTLRIHANRIETYFTGSGGGTRNHAIYFDDDTLYIFSDVKATFTGTAISWTFGIYGESGGTGICYLRGHAEAVGDDYCAALYSDGPQIKTWGDCDAISTFANSWVAGVEGDDGTIEVFGNCSGIGKGQAYGAFSIAGLADATKVYVYGKCYGETTDAGATEAAGAKTDGTGSPILRVHGDAIGVDIGGVSYGCHCDAGTLTHTCGVASGDTFDEFRSGGTLRVFMVERDSDSGAITNYYPVADDGWIGLTGGAGARITFDDQATDFVNFVSCHVGINETAPGAMQQITIDNAAVKGLFIKEAVAQTAHALDIQNSAGNSRFWVQAGGPTNITVTGMAANEAGLEVNVASGANVGNHYALSFTATEQTTGNAYGVFGFARVISAVAAQNIVAGYMRTQITGGGSAQIARGAWVSNSVPNVASSITTATGFYYEKGTAVGAITNDYGMYMEDVDRGTALNYAIYTNLGDVRFGDETVIACPTAPVLTLGAGTAGIDYQLKFDGETTDGIITWMEDEGWFQFDAFLRHDAADYRRYYHLDASSFDPGASGATWVDPDANTVGGWEITATSQDLQSTVDVHSDWDGASDLEVEVRFEIAVAGSAPGDVVVLDLDVYLKGVGETVTKVQNLSDTVTIDAAAQWTMFNASFTIDYDAVGASVDVGDVIKLVLTLDTANSDVDDVIINKGEFYYNTTHVGIESGDT